jgi:AraC-like DNA-binding protein
VPWVTAISVPHVARAVAEVGGDVAALLEQAGLRVDVRFEDRIPLGALIDLWERAVAATGRRDLPAVAARYAEPDERSLMLFVAANQPTLGDGIERYNRYYPTVSDSYRWRVVDEGAFVRAEASPPGPVHRLGWQCHLEFEAADIALITSRISATRAQPEAVKLLHAAPPADVIASFADTIGVVPQFAQDRCEVVYAGAVRDLEIPGARPALAALVEEQLEALLQAQESNAAVSSRARSVIAELLAAGTCGVDALARGLHMSRRSLQRTLADEGTSAEALIEDERKQRALAWLPQLSVEEVAARLGYSDARAFARAFKRWTGLAPSEVRSTGGRR